MDIRNANIHEAVDLFRVGHAERDGRFVGGGAASDVDKQPRIRDLNVAGRAGAVTPAESAAAEDGFVEAKRPVDIGDGEKMRDADSIPRGHFIAFLVDFYTVRGRLRCGCSHVFQKRLSY